MNMFLLVIPKACNFSLPMSQPLKKNNYFEVNIFLNKIILIAVFSYKIKCLSSAFYVLKYLK